MIFCKDIRAWFDGVPECCSSCHEDEDEMDIPLCEVEIEGETAYVCCTVAAFLQGRE